jgi:hypothetical protein
MGLNMGGARANALQFACLLVLVATAIATAGTAVAQSAADEPVVVYTRDVARSHPRDALGRLRLEAVREGRIRIIAGLDMSLRPEDELSPADRRSQSQVINHGLLDFYVNGHLVCSAEDSTYAFGNVMVVADMPSPPNGTKQAFSVSSVEIQPTKPPPAAEGASN